MNAMTPGSPGPDAASADGAPRTPVKRAGALDIRAIIGGLLGLYGVILLVLGLFFATDAELERADGENLNLWTGVGLLVAAAVFLLWVRLRPIVVPVEPPREGDDAPR